MIFSVLAGKPTPTPTSTRNCNVPPGECPGPGCPSHICSWKCDVLSGCVDTGFSFTGAYHTLADCQADGCLPCVQYGDPPARSCTGSCLWMWFGHCEGSAWSIVTDNCGSSRPHCESFCSCIYPPYLPPTDETGQTTTTGCRLF